MNRTLADSLVALGIFVASLVVGAAVLVGGLMLAARTLGNHADPAAYSSAADLLVVRGALSCDSEVTEVPEPVMDGEPSALLICADAEGSTPWTAPADVVEGDLTPLLRVLADLEPAPGQDYACTRQGGPAYDLLIRFSGTTYARVHGDTGGCGVVTSNGNDYFGADVVLDTAIALVEDQREEQRQPTAGPEPLDLSCRRVLTEQGPATSLTGSPADLVELVSCWQPNAPELGEWSEARARPADVRVLARDVGRHAAPGDARDLRCPGGLERHYFQHLVGRTAWGDLVVIAGECRRFVVMDTRPQGGDSVVWRPTPRSQRILDSLRR